ncbi:MAG: hypothetical protein IT497_08055 [Ottowia sp.]|nr:hypothetical protein [Ottowia sp.]
MSATQRKDWGVSVMQGLSKILANVERFLFAQRWPFANLLIVRTYQVF